MKLQQVNSKQPLRMLSPPPLSSGKEQEAQTGMSKLCSRVDSEAGNAVSEEDHVSQSCRPLDAKLKRDSGDYQERASEHPRDMVQESP